MDLQINNSKIVGNATSQIKDYKVVFNFEHQPNKKPAFISALGSKDNVQAFNVLITFETNNVSISIFNAPEDFDYSIISQVTAQIKQVLDQV